ncbi:Flagellum-specific ATP synthase [Aquicella siphonis]|uniref:Flagellum-specific ATP synthase n=1 Tax=Aquicella siphonis TaxID=254247 RepID=A0A5E4PJB4_9COXI|nr:FliI/YscN family ATPase [Aquicella siphonis]VVC77110.1 Flagellum-specific ATP synthase [Aquicella siphonis]
MIDLFNKKSVMEHLRKMANAAENNPSATVAGSIVRISGSKLEAAGISVPMGTICAVVISPVKSINAEVIGFSESVTYLMAIEDTFGIKQGTPVIPLVRAHSARVGMSLLGRVIDASGNPIDGKGVIESDEYYPLTAQAINPLARKRISEPLDVGIRVINSLLTVGKGQRLGIFAGSGVGKSVLLGMMSRFTRADIAVVGLIGERGREVKEFIEENLGENGLAKSVVIASPADTSPIMRVNGAALAMAIAEYYRDKGFDVLLILDSLTRYAQAQREISLTAGELPATKGYTPSVFARLAQLVERSGNGIDGTGSITAFYTVLVEGDDQHDPIADHARSILDGHIFLSRHLADAGHYPAIDIEKSVSRVMPAIATEQQLNCAVRFKKLYSAYSKNREIVNVGMYQHGADPVIDESLRYRDAMEKFLKQGMNESADYHTSSQQLETVFSQAAYR